MAVIRPLECVQCGLAAHVESKWFVLWYLDLSSYLLRFERRMDISL